MNTLFLFAQSGSPQQPSILIQMMPFILIMVGFYFLLIRPSQKKQREHAQMISELKIGDAVITSGGICGVITQLKKDRVQVKIDDQTRVEVVRSHIQALDK